MRPYRLKFVTVAEKVFVSSAAMGSVVSNVDATSVLPHGVVFLRGRWASARMGAPCTPSAGLTTACAETSSARLATRQAAARRDLGKNIVVSERWASVGGR